MAGRRISNASVHGGRACLAAASALGLLAVTGGGLAPLAANASSHREAPLTAGDPKVDNTDVYAFVSPDSQGTVTLIANWLPFQEPNGGPNFYSFQDGANYDINIDSNGDALPDITYRWVFTDVDNRGGNTFLYNSGPVANLTDPTLLFKQTYTLTRIEGVVSTVLVNNGVAAPSYTGAASMPDYAALRSQAITPIVGNGGGQTFAGQADDPFFLDLRVFDLLYGANLTEAGHDTLAGYNVQTIALQVPKSELALLGDPARNPVIGVWSSTEKKTLTLTAGQANPTGPFVQVSRLGNPLINEVISSANLKDGFNGSTPSQDSSNAALVNRVLHPEVPALIQTIYGIPKPAEPRHDLAEIFLTGIGRNAPTLDPLVTPPIQADLNAHILNQDVVPVQFVPAEELRLNMGVAVTDTPNRLGVLANDLQGFPNGRRLTDDVVDIELQALEGAAQSGTIVPALAAGDGVNTNNVAFGAVFPYVSLPNTTAVNQALAAAALPPAGNAAAQMPIGGVATGAGGVDRTGPGWARLAAGVGATVLLAGGLVALRRRHRSAAAG